MALSASIQRYSARTIHSYRSSDPWPNRGPIADIVPRISEQPLLLRCATSENEIQMVPVSRVVRVIKYETLIAETQ